MVKNLGVAVILLRNNKVLLAKRKHAYGEGLYGLPGGRVNDKETLEQCLIRESREELGIVPTVFNSMGIVKEWQQNSFFLHFIFVCKKWTGEISNLEPEKSENWQWYPLGNLPANILPGHKAGLGILLSKNKLYQVVEL